MAKINVKAAIPIALTTLGIAGTIITIANCQKDTVKAMKKLEEADIKIETKKEKFQYVWKCYIPTMVSGGITILSIAAAGYLNHKTEMALAAALALNKDNLKKFEKKAKDILGEDKVREIKTEIVKDEAEEHKDDMPKKPIPDGCITLYEPYSEQFIVTTIEKISLAKFAMNEDLARNGEASFDKNIRILGGKASTKPDHEKLGWCMENEVQQWNWSYEKGLNPWIEFFTCEFELDGEMVTSLVYNVPPELQVPEAMVSYTGKKY